MAEEEKKSLLNRLLVLFIVLPALNSFLAIIWMASIIFIMTSPIFTSQINQISVRIGLFSGAVGMIIISIYLWFIGLDYVFDIKKKENK